MLTITGTSTGAIGQTVTVGFKGAHYAGTVAGDGTWSVTVPQSALLSPVLPDGSYEVTADVSDQYGNAAQETTQRLTVHQATMPVVFSSAVATFYEIQNDWAPSQMIDGVLSGINGWSIYNYSHGYGSPGSTASQTALLTIAGPLPAGKYDLIFTIYQNYGSHQRGDFSLDYTTAASPTLSSPQTPVTIQSASSIYDLGTTFSSPSPGELFVSGDYPDTATYVIRASVNSATPITGIFLDAIQNSALPSDGPGRYSNGNFVVSEFTLDVQAATSRPSICALWLFAG